MPTLEIREVLIRYEAPLVVLAKDAKGASLIGINYGEDDEGYLFYFSRTRPAQLQSFREGSFDLLYLLTRKHTGKYHFGRGWGVENELIATKLAVSIDNGNLPQAGVFMPVPPAAASTAKRTVHIDGRWGINDLRKFSDLVQDCYAFVFALTDRSASTTKDKITDLFQKYPWRGGFSSVNFFDELYLLIPQTQRASIQKIAYASPGTIDFQMNVVAARTISALCDAINERDSKVEDAYEEAHEWLKERHWLGRSATDLRLSSADRRDLMESVATLADAFGLSGHKERVLELSNSDPLAAVKILLAYYRRLHGLADYVATGKAGDLFVG